MDTTGLALKPEERILFQLRELYQRFGYALFKMSKFEEYDLYVQNKEFLVSDGIITFTDTDGRLMALKPDVTLSIIKNTQHLPGDLKKLYYNENVYRLSGNTHSFKEIMQTGLECIGDVDLYQLCEVISLADSSLQIISRDHILVLSHMGVVSSIVDSLCPNTEQRRRLLACIGKKDADGIRKLFPHSDLGGIMALIAAHGSPAHVLETISPWCKNSVGRVAIDELSAVCSILTANGCENIDLDFSVVNDMNYYNGIVFQGYIKGIPTSVLSGGQYDKLMQRVGQGKHAVGFAIYMDQLERLKSESSPYDIDTLLLYDDDTDISLLMREVRRLTASTSGVMARKSIPEKLRYRRLVNMTKGA